MSYKVTDQIIPFWAASSGYTEGRDPLGIQNSSITTYGKLLPGLTNLTQRIRYYGFYSWVLWQFQQKVAHTGSSFTASDQQFFIRKAELLLAFIMDINFPEETAVSGKQYTHDFTESNPDWEVIDIRAGATYNPEKGRSPYWSLLSGAFGQYYVGSMIRLGLIYPQNENELFGITKSGEKLARYYEENVKSQATTFLEVLEKGVWEKELSEKLNDFALHLIPENSDEWKFYLEMLFSEDGDRTLSGTPLALRRQTLISYLSYLEHNQADNPTVAYREDLYISKGKKGDNPKLAETTWYYYQLNEYLHYAYEAILWSILKYLEKERSVRIPVFTETLRDETVGWYKKEFGSGYDIQKILDELNEEVVELSGKLSTFFRNGNYEEGLWLAMKIILTLYKENQDELERLAHLQTELNIQRAGSAVDEMETILRGSADLSFEIWAERLLIRLIDMHIAVAYRKMGWGQKNVLKIDIEDGHFIWINSIHPSFTSPRLDSVNKFLIDLKMVDKENMLTENGLNYLHELS